MIVCHHCGKNIGLDHKPARQETCPFCDQPLHCCLNCIFYNEKAFHQCRETEAEYVSDKASPNFCDYFRPSDQTKETESRADEARRKLDELFGGR
ncbi:MAG TPA: hypothetical protein ENN03_10205 [bacterium]|nr:hypothetical protein [bacterium]